MRVFAVLLLLLVGVVFATAPAGLLAKLTPEWLDFKVWLGVIFFYYFLAPLCPSTRSSAASTPCSALCS